MGRKGLFLKRIRNVKQNPEDFPTQDPTLSRLNSIMAEINEIETQSKDKGDSNAIANSRKKVGIIATDYINKKIKYEKAIQQGEKILKSLKQELGITTYEHELNMH